MKKQCAIISGGKFSPLENIEKADCIIACDKGCEYAAMSNVTPDLIIGDFDSFSGNLPEGIPTIRLPREKDDTDTMTAIKYAIKNGYNDLILYCALGGRLDHLLCNIQSGAYAVNNGASLKIIDENDYIYFISNEEIRIPEKDGYSLSVFALTDKCENLTISGTKYTLNNAEVSSMVPFGESNEWEGEAVISVGNGIIAVILSKMER